MSVRHLIARLSALSFTATAVLLSIATSPAQDPSVQQWSEGPAFTMAQASEERRFEIVVEATAAVLSRESYANVLHVSGLARTELPEVPDRAEAPAADDAGDADAEAIAAPHELTPEEAAEHPAALSLELTRLSDDTTGGESRSRHLVLDRAETLISVELPLDLSCAGETCSARYEVSWRGPSDLVATGAVELSWGANAAVLYVLAGEDGEDDYSVPEGASLTVQILPIDDDGDPPSE